MRKIKFKKVSLLVTLLALVLIGLIGCGGASESSGDSNGEEAASTSNNGSGDKLKVGIMLSFTGPYAPLAEGVQNGFDLYLKENNHKLGGLDVEVIYEDDEN